MRAQRLDRPFTGLRLTALLIAVFFLILFQTPPLMSTELPVQIKSGCEDGYPPFLMRDKNGEATGFAIELLDSVLHKMGFKATYASGTWHEQKAKLENREIDVYPMAGRNPEREKIFDFSVPYLTFNGAIIVRKDNSDINELKDLAGKKTALIKSDMAEEYLRIHYPDFNYITAPVFIDAVRLLEEGKCDAIVAPRMIAQLVIAEQQTDTIKIVPRPLEEIRQEFGFAVPEDSKELLAMLNEGLAKVTADGTYRRLHAKWFAGLELPEQRKIIIGGSYDYPPYEFIDKTGQPSGYNVDIVKAVFAAIGVDYEIQLGPWNEMVEKFEKGEIDALQGMLYSLRRDEKFDFSTPHAINTGVIVSRRDRQFKNISMNDLHPLTTAVQNGDILHEFAIENGLKNKELLIVASQEEALTAVNHGKADCALVSRLTALYWIKQKNLVDLEISDIEMISHDYCFAVLNDSKSLLAKVNEGLRMIEDRGVFREIQVKWFGIDSQPRVNLRDTIKYIAIVTLPLIAVLLTFWLWNWSLRHEVSNRTSELKKSEQQFRTLIESAPYAIFVQTDHKFAFINAAGCRLFGCSDPSEIIGRDILSLFDESFHDLLKTRIKLLNYEKQYVPPIEIKAIKLNGDLVTIETSATPIEYNEKNGAMVFARDLTEKIRLEEQLRQAQKMDAIGQLAGGIAHDYNNMLGVILGYAELAMNRTSEDIKTSEYLEEVIKAARKSGEITSQLLIFARKQQISPKPLDVKVAVENSSKMLRRLIGENIELVCSFPDTPCMTMLDPVQFDQIMANLCINARDAINGRGKIEIKLEKLYSIHNSTIPLMPKGKYLKLSVADNGSGISEENLGKIFEPFFTTKEKGKGTGLGLATVYGIVKQNAGFIDVQSQPGQGTVFYIYFPELESNSDEHCEPVINGISHGTGETILVVEDDPSILNLTKKILENIGYKVITEDSPDKAIEIFKSRCNEISLVISDVIMPEMNGNDLIGILKQHRPDLKCMLMTGYSSDILEKNNALPDGIPVMTKPFTISVLAQKVKKILDT